jgi:hypothetical protein
MKSTHILALDFDGVVIDSILECLVTAYNAYSIHSGRNEFRTNIDQFELSEIAAFRRSRIYIRRGEDYVFLLQAAADHVRVKSQDEFDRFLELNSGFREEYRNLFYSQRKTLQERDLPGWLALNPMYPGIESFLRLNIKADEWFVVTTKDLESVHHILNSRNIPFHPENLFQASKTFRKPHILSHISSLRGVEEKNIHFVDDHPATLIEVAEQTEVLSYCAIWGYNSSEQMAGLQKNNISVLTLEDFLATF